MPDGIPGNSVLSSGLSLFDVSLVVETINETIEDTEDEVGETLFLYGDFCSGCYSIRICDYVLWDSEDHDREYVRNKDGSWAQETLLQCVERRMKGFVKIVGRVSQAATNVLEEG